MEQLPENRPLWEVHIINYQTSNAAGILIFKLHHSLGDGYSLMGTLLSCLQRLDNPSLPVTFPSRKSTTTTTNNEHRQRRVVPRFVSKIYNTIYDFGFAVMKSSNLITDDRSPLRSGVDGVEFRPITVFTMGFSMDQLKQIKRKLNVTINDVISGVIMYGARLYMEAMEKNSGRKAKSTALVIFNTRAAGVEYKSVKEMIKPNAEMPWGNHFTFLPISIPKLTSDDSNPLSFVFDAHQMIKNKRSSASSFLMAKLLETMRKIKGSEATSRFIYGSLKNTTMGITNVIGPIEPLSLANHPIKGIYSVMAGSPQSISITIVSYVETLRVAFGVEKDYINPSKFKSSIETSFQTISQAVVNHS